MGFSYTFLRCLLPPLPEELGEEMPLSFDNITGMVKRNIDAKDYPLLEAFLSSIDVSNFESLNVGRNSFDKGGMLTDGDIQNRRNLPLFIKGFLEEREKGISRAYVFDRLWERYYMYVYSLAMERGSSYLMQYIPWEVGLRNVLVALRTRKSGEDPASRTFLTNLGTLDFSSVIAKAGEEHNPLVVERYLDRKRLEYIFHCEGTDPFSFDAILAYLSRSMIYDRWAIMNSPYDVNIFLNSGVQV